MGLMINWPKVKMGLAGITLMLGPMGVGVSENNLVSAFANCGGAATIPSVGLGHLRNNIESNFRRDYIKDNCDALRFEIRESKKKSKDSKGMIGVNVMKVLTDFDHLVGVAVEEEVDYLTFGAGRVEAKNLKELMGEAPIGKVGIISYGRFAQGMCEDFDREGYALDGLIVEGPKAGGHLGFGEKRLNNPKFVENALEKEVARALEEVRKFGDIPIFAAGGIYTGADIKMAERWGCAGVQMATRFVTTSDCKVHENFKQEYIRAKKEDMRLIKSPVGLIGRAVYNDFLERVSEGKRMDIICKHYCIEGCQRESANYCILQALVNAQKGNFNEGFAFGGVNAWRATPETCLDEDGNWISVETLINQRLAEEYDAAS